MGTEYKMSPDYSAAKKEKLDYTSEASRTGFMMRKYFEESTPINDVQSANGLTPVIRYAEVLLGYLECLVEDNQTITQGILDETINAVRGRASVNMPPVTEVTPAKLREIVRHERRIELAMEGIRYWDIMRWGIAHEVLSQKIWGALTRVRLSMRLRPKRLTRQETTAGMWANVLSVIRRIIHGRSLSPSKILTRIYVTNLNV